GDLASLALLVGLALRNGDAEPAGRPVDPFAINCTQFRAPERPGEPDEQRGAIAGISYGVAERSQDGDDPFRCQCRCAALWAPVSAPDASECQPDELRPDRVRQAS